MDIDALVTQKIEADTEFQTSLADLSEEDKEAAIATKKTEVLSNEFTALTEKANEADKQKELANNYKIRAEKAEAAGKVIVEKNPNDLSPKDALLLAKAAVDLEDVDEVLEYAKFKKVSIQDALKSPMLTAMLSERKEERETAQATATGKQRTETPAITEAAILSKAEKGELPKEEDASGMAKLVEAEMNRKIQARK